MSSKIALTGLFASFVFYSATFAQRDIPLTSDDPVAVVVNPETATPVAVPIAQDSAIALLRKRVTEPIKWSDITLGEVVSWLKDQSEGKVNVIAKWKALQADAITEDSTVSLELSGVTVSEVLDAVLENIAEGNPATYHAYGNKLVLSSRADLNVLVRRVYDMTDVLFRVPDMGRTAPSIDLSQAGRSAGGGGGGGGGGKSVFSAGGGGQQTDQQEAGPQGEKLLEDQLKALSLVIIETVAPDTWDEKGGKGVIKVYRRSLIVYNTIEVHEQIAGSIAYGR